MTGSLYMSSSILEVGPGKTAAVAYGTLISLIPSSAIWVMTNLLPAVVDMPKGTGDVFRQYVSWHLTSTYRETAYRE